MPRTISDQKLALLGEFVTARFGLYFPKKRWNDLARKMAAAAERFGYDNPAPFIDWLLSAQLTKEQLDILADCLTIGETYFFREKRIFEVLESQVLPGLIASRRENEKRLRIWSAGCSTGEEAYSIAILLRRMIVDLSEWSVTILATDLNPASLRKAARGEYGDWSFRGVPRWAKERYFTGTGEGRFAIAGPVRRMVTFSQLNLAADTFPSLANNTNAMDIIFCRNVLMYFTAERMAQAVEQFHHSLVAGGWLIVSPCETSPVQFRHFETVSFQGAVLYRKEGGEKQTPPVPACGGTCGPAALSPPQALPVVAPPQYRSLPAVPPLSLPETATPMDDRQGSPYDEALMLYRKGLYAESAAKLSEQAANGDRDLRGKTATLLARAYANQGKFAEALEWVEKAIAVNKLDPELRFLQAVIFQEQGEVEAAITALKKTLYLDQSFVLAHFALANLSRLRGRAKEAAKHLENAATLLRECGDDDMLPGSEGMSARRLGEIIGAGRMSTGNR